MRCAGWIFRILLLAAAIFGPLLPLSAQSPRNPQKWALLIGIDVYRDRSRINTLGGASADARALKAALIDAAGFPEKNIRLLVSDADPTAEDALRPERNAILNELARLVEKVRPGDTVFISYAGHGIQTGETAYLLPYDTDAFDDDTLTDTALEVTKFRDRLLEVNAGTLILVFDMCRNDPRAGSKSVAVANPLTQAQVKSLANPAKLSEPSNPTNPPQVFMLFACEEGQRSYEWADKQRGYFSYFLEEGMRGKAADEKGTVYMDRLMEYVAQQVEGAVTRREGAAQRPFHRQTGSAQRFAVAHNVVYSVRLTAPSSSAVVDTTAQFTLRISPRAANVEIDGVPVTERPVQVDLGVEREKVVVLQASAPGYETQKQGVTLRRGLNPPISILLRGGPSGIESSVVSARRVPLVLRVTAEAATEAQISSQRNNLRVSVRRIGRTPMQVFAYASPSFLREGRQYVLRFRARADAPRQMQTRCQLAGGDRHPFGLNSFLSLTTEWKDFELPFTATGLRFRGKLYPLYAPLFVLGNQTGTVWIEDCTLEEK